MTNRWEQIEKICQSALELEESPRKAFLEKACDGDEELRQKVESLLRFEEPGDRFIEEPALEVAAKLIAQGPASPACAPRDLPRRSASPPTAIQSAPYRATWHR